MTRTSYMRLFQELYIGTTYWTDKQSYSDLRGKCSNIHEQYRLHDVVTSSFRQASVAHSSRNRPILSKFSSPVSNSCRKRRMSSLWKQHSGDSPKAKNELTWCWRHYLVWFRAVNIDSVLVKVVKATTSVARELAEEVVGAAVATVEGNRVDGHFRVQVHLCQHRLWRLRK